MPKHSVRAENLRAMNMQLVLAHALASDVPPSRAQIASGAGLTRATSSRLGDELVAGGLLDELPPPPATGPGRPALGLIGSARVIGIGVDIGVDALRVIAINLRGVEVARRVRIGDLVGSRPADVLPELAVMIADVVRQLQADARLCGITIAVPGLVDSAAGVLLDAPNLGWHDVPIAEDVAAALADTPAAGHLPRPQVMNEANLAALTAAFRAPGAPRPRQHFAYLSGGIGVGAAIVEGGTVMTGEHGWAGEIGHLTVDPNGPDCRCGSTGCLERYVGREALTEALGRHAETGDALDVSAQALGVSLAALVNLLDVPVIVLGGQLAELLERTRERIEQVLRRRAMAARRVPIELTATEAGEDAAVLGAAYAAFTDLLAAPIDFLAAPAH